MGLEAKCVGRRGAESGEGRLQYEGGTLQFRGAFRLDIAVKDLKKVSVAGDELALTWGTAKASFALGSLAAAKWAGKILNPPSLLDKLGIKAGQRVGLKGKFEAAFLAELAGRVKASPVRAGSEYDVLLMLAETPADLDAVPALVPRLTQAGALWVLYPKGGKSIKESEVRQAGLGAALVDNKTCAFSETLTALRWVRPRTARSGPR